MDNPFVYILTRPKEQEVLALWGRLYRVAHTVVGNWIILASIDPIC